MFEFIGAYKTRVERLKNILPGLAAYFRAMALVEAYVFMTSEFKRRAQRHQEIARIPEYLELMNEHFDLYAREHINLEKEQIWNADFVGTIQHLEAWQQAGYPLNRTKENHARRKHIWKAIWEGTDVTLRIKRERNFRGAASVWWQNIKLRPREPKSPHDIATAEGTIRARNENYEATVRYVPFWLPLEYGTGRVPGGLSGGGYPQVVGMHFISVAEQRIPTNMSKYAQLLDSYLASVIDGDSAPSFSDAESWLKSRVTLDDMSNTDIDVFRLAQEVSGAWANTQ